ncbi:arabinogalactan endo-1,4-beta-galactosidase [Arsenicibacter rosenii]|uniref:Arabinogalactan endo-beta-1,4-galactanase n=2 Tax=Arsenicibacter rosenii TaxID=1750698 RepID=A0A1S2VRC5_9BACT|nr:arabinogalactan endo-1,4-beta-galactosidase [Arsenicibacter rosenii]
MKKWSLVLAVLAGHVAGCKGQAIPSAAPDRFVKGADVSWITQQEKEGVRFYQSDGKPDDIFSILKNKGMNAIRLRVWVNPQGGWNGIDDVLVKAKRVKAAGMRLMIDFHYSDNWADPGKQTKPAAWQNLSFDDLKKAVSSHTTAVLTRLKENDITPEWVQVGNETNDGMLWPDGRASTNMANFAALINAGYDAVKAVSPTAQVIVHISNGYDQKLFQWMFGGLAAQQTRFDMIGMSLYPSAADWATKNSQCLSTVQDMIARYHKPVMVVEVGMSASDPATANAFITDLIGKMRNVPDSMGQGVLYWEPQSYGQWQGYDLGAFDNTGKPTAAMDAFRH